MKALQQVKTGVQMVTAFVVVATIALAPGLGLWYVLAPDGYFSRLITLCLMAALAFGMVAALQRVVNQLKAGSGRGTA